MILLFVLMFTGAVVSRGHSYSSIIPEIISGDVQKLIATNKIPQSLHNAVHDLKNSHSSDIFCQTCALVSSQGIDYRRGGANKESMRTLLQKLCRIFTDWNPIACDGYIDIELDTLLYIIDNRQELTGARACAIYYQSSDCQDPNTNKWVIPLPPPPKIKKHTRPSIHGESLKILHLTDFHFDPLYVAGSNAACDLPLCCQEDSGVPKTPSQAAGFWGDYRKCDMPWHTITNLTKNLAKDKYDLIYYTGDVISHKSWATDKEGNIKAIKQLFGHFQDVFKNTSFYPILGNHEPHPTDFYSPSNNTVPATVTTQWVFDLVAALWKPWLPSNATTTILKGGYYTALVRNKFRIIALNSNVCFISNLWLDYNDIDPYDQLKWLVDVLSEAEKNNEIVHILSHIPPGEMQCSQQWSNQFHQIINRFAPIIAAQFNGHTHYDELRLFQHPNNTKQIINTAFNAGSFTTFVGFNPNYRIYSIDSTNYTVADYDHFTFNLTDANLNSNVAPKWYKLYSFKEAYGLKTTSYGDLADLVTRLGKNKTLVQQYYRFMGRNSDPYMSQACDDHCLARTLCTITAVESDAAMNCLKNKQQIFFSHHNFD